MKENIKLECESKIAYESLDHLNPLGTSQDNSKNKRFNRKIYQLFKRENRQMRILDLGCSGGGFVRECINDGCLAVGLEGSDFSQRMSRAEWATIPDFLFTCDISKDFQLYKDDKKTKFNLITAWEVLEHIEEKDLETLIRNIKKHLYKNGIFICSISTGPSLFNGVELHRTRKPFDWWVNLFEKKGFYLRRELYDFFHGQYIRGRKEKLDNFHLILSLENKKIKMKNPIKEKLKDIWVGSFPQIFLKYLVNGEL